MIDAIATAAGRPAPRIDKRAADDRVYRIDCEPLLRQYEMLAEVTRCEAPGLQISEARTRQGRGFEVRIAGGEVPEASPYKDHAISATLRTTQGTLSIAVDVRVYP